MSRLVAFFVMSLMWGLTWLPVKLAAPVAGPLHLAAARFVLAGILFGAAALVLRVPLGTTRIGRMVAATLFVTTLPYAGVFWGVAHAPSGLAAVVNLSLIPVFSIAIGAIYGEERITGRRLGAVVLGILGLGLLFSAAIGRSEGGDDYVAVGLAALAGGTALYAWGAVLSRPLTREMPALAVAFWETLGGGLALVPLAIAVEGFDPARTALLFTDPTAGLSLAFLVVGGSLVGFLIYLWLLREWGPFRAGLFAFVSPAVALLAGVVGLGESFGPIELLGMAVMGSATALVLPRPERAREAEGGVSAS